MDLTKLGRNTWINVPLSAMSIDQVESFRRDLQEISRADDLHRSKDHRSFMHQSRTNDDHILPLVHTKTSATKSKKQSKTSTLPSMMPSKSYDFSAMREHPPNRTDIARLEREFEDRLHEILRPEDKGLEALEENRVYQPYKDMILAIRNKNLDKFNLTYNQLSDEPWLDSLIRTECMTTACDETSEKIVGMLSVMSTELGNTLRKVKNTYRKAFEELTGSWEILRNNYQRCDQQLAEKNRLVERLEREIQVCGQSMQTQHEDELKDQEKQYDIEKKLLEGTIQSQQGKIDQLSESLRSLNNLLKTMQVSTTSAGMMLNNEHIDDIKEKCRRLEFEKNELQGRVMKTDKLAYELNLSQTDLQQKDVEIKELKDEIANLHQQIKRRDDGIAGLLEKDLIRAAEFDKIQVQLQKREKDFEESLMKDVATSVLCIRCKKSLDDTANLRQQSLDADHLSSQKQHRVKCEIYRLLLPNLKGRYPERSVAWLRKSMRAILISKMQQDVNLQSLAGEAMSIRFPQYVYAWFERSLEGLRGQELTKQLVLADDDRWALYYGIRALSRDNDPECMILWSLLDEFFHDDGSQFVSQCLSVILSISGREVWEQFGSAAVQNYNVTVTMAASTATATKSARPSSKQSNAQPVERINRHIWIPVKVAKEGAKIILKRAMDSHLAEVLDAIDAFTVVPSNEEDNSLTSLQPNANGNSHADELPRAESMRLHERSPKSPSSPKKRVPTAAEVKKASHVNLYLWLRLMLKQLQAEQTQRRAAVKLMFETASIGALTTASANDTANEDEAATAAAIHVDGHVEYPQFASICKAIFHSIPTTDIASFYAQCYHSAASHPSSELSSSKKLITAEVFLKVADLKGLFSRYMKFSSLPLFAHYHLLNDEFINQQSIHEENKKSEEEKEREAIDNMLRETLSPNSYTNQMQLKSPTNARDARVIISSPNRRAAGGSGFRAGGASPKPNNPASGTTNLMKLIKENDLRAGIGSLVHRKYALIRADLQTLAKNLPERWKSLLIDAMTELEKVVDESYTKVRYPGANGGSDETTIISPRSPKRGAAEQVYGPSRIIRQHQYIDGFQPYVHYRRLLSLASYIKSLSDNPLLPPEIFTASLHSAEDEDLLTPSSIKPSSTSLVTTLPFQISIHRAEKLLSSLETSLFYARLDHQQISASKYQSFEKLRLKFYARRIIRCVRKFLTAEVMVPSCIRQHMRRGYLWGLNTSLSFPKREAYAIYSREVHHEPWWAQALLSEIYLFKLQYDSRNTAEASISLSQAVVAYFYIRTGSVEVAERLVHDLMFCVNSYRAEVSRLRLFSALLGETSTSSAKDIDAETAATLRSPQAWMMYMNLLRCIREEVYYASKNTASSMASASASAVVTVTSAMKPVQGGVLNMDENESMARPMMTVQVPQTISTINERSPYSTSTSATSILNFLFSSSDNALLRTDGKDVWLEGIDLVSRAVNRWSKQQKCLDDEHSTLFTELLQQLVTPSNTMLEVDDVAWLVMLQWAKLMTWFASRGTARNLSMDGERSAKKLLVKNTMTLPRTILEQRQYSQEAVRNILDVLYLPADADIEGNTAMLSPSTRRAQFNTFDVSLDLPHALTKHMALIAQGNAHGDHGAGSVKVLSDLFRSTVLWDMSSPSSSSSSSKDQSNNHSNSNALMPKYGSSPVYQLITGKRFLESYWVGCKQFINEVGCYRCSSVDPL
jgi:hypothetical protein